MLSRNLSGQHGIFGLAPDTVSNGPSFLSRLYNLSLITNLSIGI